MRTVLSALLVSIAVLGFADPCGTLVHDQPAGDSLLVFSDGHQFFFGSGSALYKAEPNGANEELEVLSYSRPFHSNPTHAAVNGSLAVVGAGNQAHVMDLEPQGAATSLWKTTLTGWVIGVRSAGQLAAVYWWFSEFHPGAWGEGVEIIDLSDPENPSVVGHIETPRSQGSIQMTPDSFLYLHQERLWIYDLSQPATPTLISETEHPGWNRLISAKRNTIVVNSDEGLLFVDFTNPDSPEILATYQPAARVRSIDWIGNQLVMVLANDFGFDDSLEIIDVSTATPIQVSFVEGFFDGRIDAYWVDGFACESGFCLAVEDDPDSPERLRLVDIRNPASPILGNSVTKPSRFTDLTASDQRLAAADSDERLWMLELGDDGSYDERLVAGVPVGLVDIRDDLMFVSSELKPDADRISNRLQIFDLADGGEPEIVGEIDWELPDATLWDRFQATGEGIVVLAFDQSGADHLEVIDVGDPSQPVRGATVRLPSSPASLSVAGDLVFVRCWSRELVVIDISDPLHPTRVGLLGLDSYGEIVSWGRYVYVVTDRGVVVVDAGRPSRPIVVAEFESDHRYPSYKSVGAIPGFLFVHAGNFIDVFDVRIATAPRLVRTIEELPCAPLPLGGLTIDGTLLVQWGGDCGFQILDISECIDPDGVPSVNFTVSPPFPIVGEPARFDDHTYGAPSEWYWDFGDGATATDSQPQHVFGIPGSYTVALTVGNSHGSSSATLIIDVLEADSQPVADFSWRETTSSIQPVEFFDASPGRPTAWVWDFGDGFVSHNQDPVHYYSLPGDYEVTLEVGNGFGSDAITKTLSLERLMVGGIHRSDSIDQVIAAAASTPGHHDTLWRTDLTFFNPSDEVRRVYLFFLPRGDQDNGDAAVRTFINLNARQTLVVEDVVGGLFGLEETSGALATMLTSDPNAASSTSRTFTLAPDGGSFGQAVPSRTMNEIPTGTSSQVILGLQEDDDFRANAGFVNLTDSTQRFQATAFKEDGQIAGEHEIEVGRFGYLQIESALEEIGGSNLDHGYLVIDVAAEVVQAYASVIDNRTGDAVFTPAEQMGLDPPTETWLLPAVASVSGANGTSWQSQLEVLNPTGVSSTVTLTFLETGREREPSIPHELTVESGQLLRIDDVVEELFDLRTSGALLLKSSGPLRATSRTFTTSAPDAAFEGTFGQRIPAIPMSTVLSPGMLASLPALREDEGFRSNVGFVNPTPDPAVVEILALSLLGEQQASTTIELAPWEHRQLNHFLRTLGGLEQATLELVVHQGRVAAYASVVDNVTGDPVYLNVLQNRQR